MIPPRFLLKYHSAKKIATYIKIPPKIRRSKPSSFLKAGEDEQSQAENSIANGGRNSLQ
jgi:hypothetical protein